jgi:5-methylcytosine-specific restriction protein A
MHAPFLKNQVYNRRQDIHGKFGGQTQGGISTPRGQPCIFLFTAHAGEQYGYNDGWINNSEFLYFEEGQAGDMRLARGNKAVLDHARSGKRLMLFEAVASGFYQFLGELLSKLRSIKKRLTKRGDFVAQWHFVFN